MKSRTPVPRTERPPLPAFAPVPRKCNRHDGWTPERQRAFIEALADTGSVSRAAAQVNMSPEGAYYLRRQPGADGFRRAWEAALDYGVARMKDIAFERAIEGHLVPLVTGGKLIGYRRIYNDRLLMFCLRHYGQDANGKRTTINYFSTRASAGVSSPERAGGPSAAEPMVEGALAQAETTTVRTVITGSGSPGKTGHNLDDSTALIDRFEGVALDDQARHAIHQVLQACAARRRAAEGTADDPAEPFFAVQQEPREMLVHDPGYEHPRKELRRPPAASDVVVEADAFLEQSPRKLVQSEDQHRSSDSEFDWQMLDQEEEMQAIEDAVASVKRAKQTR